MSETFEKKCEALKNIFSPLSAEERYQILMRMGRQLPPFPENQKIPENIVAGCQSILYLHVSKIGDKLYFGASADALISAGLAALLIAVYSGETAETILKRPPEFIHALGITASLSLNRSNGLAQIHLRMKQEALKSLIQ